MKKQANVGIELTAQDLAQAHGGLTLPGPMANIKSVIKAVKSVWRTISSWF